MLNQPIQSIISYPDLSGFRIFYSCALIFYMFLRNEPIFRSSKKTVNLFLNNTNDYSPATIDYKTNPFLPLLRHATRTPFLAQNGRFYKNLRQKAHFYPFQPRKFEPKKGTKHPHDRSALTGQKCGFHDPSPQNRLF